MVYHAQYNKYAVNLVIRAAISKKASINNVLSTYIRTFSRMSAAVTFDSSRSPAVAFKAIDVSLHFVFGIYITASSNNGRKLSTP